MGYRLIASGYTQTEGVSGERDSGACGIGTFEFDPAEKTTSLIDANPDVQSPSFCQLVGKRLYAASEMLDKGGLASFSMNSEDMLPTLISDLNFQKAAGTCYVLANPNSKYLYGADYNSGSVSICELDPSGGISGSAHLLQHEGSNAPRSKSDPNFDRQLTPHVHTLSIVPGTDLLAAVDLGLDLIVLYQLDESGNVVPGNSHIEGAKVEDGKWTLERCLPGTEDATAIAQLPIVPAGVVEIPLHNGPRIIAYHPTLRVAALICELGCKLMLFKYSPDGLTWELYSEFDLLEGATQEELDRQTPLSAHCEFSKDGRFLYTSTRGTDIMATFAIDDDGNATKMFSCSSEGATPRHFALSPDNRFLAVANQTGNNVAMFERNADTGELESVMQFDFPTPSCIVWE